MSFNEGVAYEEKVYESQKEVKKGKRIKVPRSLRPILWIISPATRYCWALH